MNGWTLNAVVRTEPDPDPDTYMTFELCPSCLRRRKEMGAPAGSEPDVDRRKIGEGSGATPQLTVGWLRDVRPRDHAEEVVHFLPAVVVSVRIHGASLSLMMPPGS